MQKPEPILPVTKPLDHLVLCGVGRADALVLRDETLSYDMLNNRVGKLAHWLTVSRLAAGDRIATWLPKSLTACIMPLAAARAGVIHVPINPVLKRAQVAHILADSGARMLITNLARINSLQAGDCPPDCVIWEEDDAHVIWSDKEDEAVPSYRDVDELAAILYTSGSTGKPKGVMLSHANLWLGAMSVKQYLGMLHHDRTLCVLPLSFDYGQNQLLSTWAAGASAIPLDYLAPRDVIKMSAKYAITTLAAVPPLWTQLTEQEWPDEAVAKMRRLTNSGGALTPVLVQKLRAIFPDTQIVAMYGLTEAFRSTYLPPELIDDNPTAMGNAIPYAEIMVVNDEGKAAAPGQEGELVHAGPLVAQGYWQDEAKTKKRFKLAPRFSEYGGIAVWSGDRVKRGADGLLYFVGRKDAMIKSSGNRISPAEIEGAAIATKLVAEAVAFGVADDRLGHAIVLIVRPAPKAQMAGLKEALVIALKRELPTFMIPQAIEVRDTLPRNPNGKLDRNALITAYLGEGAA